MEKLSRSMQNSYPDRIVTERWANLPFNAFNALAGEKQSDKRLNNYSRTGSFLHLWRSYTGLIRNGKALPFPRKIQIQTISSCNGRCIFCPYDKVNKNLSQGIMEETLFRKIIDEATASPYLAEVLLELHNEPLSDNRIFQLIKYIKTKDKTKACTLVTNGELIEKYKVSEILASEVDRLVISLNAYSAETYERICPGLDFERVKRNIIKLLTEIELKNKLELNFVVMEQNRQEIHQALAYWKREGARTRTLTLSNRAGALKNFTQMKPRTSKAAAERSDTAWKYLVNKMRQITGCYSPFLEMSILFNGDVILCCQDWNRTTILGNLYRASIKEIWNSDELNKIRRLIMKKQYSQIAACKHCSKVV
jgi:radical SAM protein with 4Fe4S-binding SPASM domain